MKDSNKNLMAKLIPQPPSSIFISIHPLAATLNLGTPLSHSAPTIFNLIALQMSHFIHPSSFSTVLLLHPSFLS
jgi:hypothetical protein